MAPWLRVVGATVVLGAGAAVMPYVPATGPAGTATAVVAEAAVAYPASGVDAGPVLSRSPSPSPSSGASSSPTPVPPSERPSRAGNRPGEGRERPGRHEPAEEPRGEREQRDEADDGAGTERPDVPRRADEETVSRAPGTGDSTPEGPASPAAVPVPSTSSEAAEPHTVASTEPVLRILPLGSGLVLIGLGFGLAFVALRMRQAAG